MPFVDNLADNSPIERAIARAQETRRLTNVVIEAARDLIAGQRNRDTLQIELEDALAALDSHTGHNGASRAAD